MSSNFKEFFLCEMLSSSRVEPKEPQSLELELSPEMSKKKDESQIYNFFSLPIHLEKVFYKIVVILLDAILGMLLYTPVRFVLNMKKLIFNRSGFGIQAWCDFAHTIIIVIPFMMLMSHELAVFYHGIRGQSSLKLYGLILSLELFDRMFTALEDKFINFLWSKLEKGTTLINCKRDLALIIICIYLHSLDLFTQMIIFNVVVNSDTSALIILLFVHNFTKLKGSIFKKLEQKQYFVLTTLDAKERLQRILYLFLITNIPSAIIYEFPEKMLTIIVVDIIIDWIKHYFLIFLNSFPLNTISDVSNKIKDFVFASRFVEINVPPPNSFIEDSKKFLDAPEQELVQKRIPDSKIKCTFRVGLVIFPYIVLIFRVWILKLRTRGVSSLFFTILIMALLKLFCSISLFFMQKRSRLFKYIIEEPKL